MKLNIFLPPSFLLAALLFYAPATWAQTSTAPLKQDQELWTGSIYTSTFRAGFCLNNDNVRGVVFLKTWTGKVDVYHFYGSMHDDIIEVAHGSGHKFKGSFTSDVELKGKLKLKTGRVIDVTAQRYHNANLDEDCRPSAK